MKKLHLAAQSGNLRLLQTLAGRGYNLDEPTKDKWTPMHYAVLAGQSDVVRYLIDQDISVNTTTALGQSPLHFAAQNGDEFIIAVLVENGAILDAQDVNGRTPLHYAAENAAKMSIKFLLDFQADPNVMDHHYCTPLQLAVEVGDTECCQLLLDGGSTPDICYDKISIRDPVVSWSALHVAAKNSNLEVMRLMLESNANADVANNMNMTPLHVASEKNCPEMIDLLIEFHADPMAVDKDKETPLIIAIRARHLENVKRLCDNMTLNITNNKEETPLHVAAKLGFYEIVEYLLENGANPYCIDSVGNTPLHNAVINKHKECVRMLLEYRSDIMARNYDNQSAYALSTGEIATMMKLYLDRNMEEIRAEPMDKTPRSTKTTPSRLKNKLSPSKQGMYPSEQETPSRLAQRTPKKDSDSGSVSSYKSEAAVPNDLAALENMVRSQLVDMKSGVLKQINNVKKLLNDLKTDMGESD